MAYETKGLMELPVEIDIPGKFSVYNSLAAIAIYISRNGSRLIGDDEYDDYDFDFDEDEDASDEYCGECAIDDDAQKSVVIEDNASEEK